MGRIAPTLTALVPAARSGGFVAVGEPYWRTWPLADGFEPEDGEDLVKLSETIERFRSAGLEPLTLIAASQDDWDRYESLHWLAVEEWLEENPEHPDAKEIRSNSLRYQEAYLRWQQDLVGWAIIVGRKR